MYPSRYFTYRLIYTGNNSYHVGRYESTNSGENLKLIDTIAEFTI